MFPISNLCRTLLYLSSLLPAAAAELRPLSADRPDTTESPYTVDPGHFQIEVEIASWNANDHELSLGEFNLKAGLDASMDLQLVLPLYSRTRGGAEGFGDIEIRLKRNLWGNDSGSTAFAVMPYVKLPTARDTNGNGEYEGGLILPFAFEGPSGWSFGTQAEFAVDAGEDDRGHQFSTLASFTASHDLTSSTAVFLELVGVLHFETGEEAYFNTGVTWEAVKNWQLDAGVRVGLTRDSDDFTPFLGMSAKF